MFQLYFTYYVKTKGWDAQYVAQLRQHHLWSELPHPQEANSASCERVGWGSSLHHLPISRLTKPPYRTDFARSANNTNATEGVHMSPRNFREAVFDEHGTECIVCGRSPENGYNRSQELSVHHLNGDHSDNRPENGIPARQSCHIHIHRTDEPPYRQWHRQLYVEHRSVWNQHTDLPYNGPHLTRDLAERLYGDDGGTPEAVKYLDDDDDDEDDGSAGVTEVP